MEGTGSLLFLHFCLEVGYIQASLALLRSSVVFEFVSKV